MWVIRYCPEGQPISDESVEARVEDIIRDIKRVGMTRWYSTINIVNALKAAVDDGRIDSKDIKFEVVNNHDLCVT
jgi:hypothetical protein